MYIIWVCGVWEGCQLSTCAVSHQELVKTPLCVSDVACLALQALLRLLDLYCHLHPLVHLQIYSSRMLPQNQFLPMSCRILFEVANLERSTTLKNEECLLFLADAVRLGYKAHQFAGGFTVDSAELFGKVKRLTQYYTRSMDPTWLKDTTKFTSSDRQRWDHVQRK